MLPGSHGMSYLPKEIRAQFGGDSAQGTLSDLVTAFPTHLIKAGELEFNIDCTISLIELYENKFAVGLGTLLSMVPEMSNNYKLATGKPSRCFPLEITVANDPRKLTWEFSIGDGEIRPDSKIVEDSFPNCPRVDRHGKTVVSVVAADADKIKACIYTDLRGGLWFIDNPFFPIILPEIAVHFLALSVFSNLMRYRPDEWGNVLTNDVSSDVFILTKHYFSNLERKFQILVLRSASRYIPYISRD